MVTFSVNYHHNMSEEVDKTYTYLLVVKFHTEDGDLDEGIYVMKAHYGYKKRDIVAAFNRSNSLLNAEDSEGNSRYSELGLNIDTLIEDVSIYTRSSIGKVDESFSGNVDGLFFIDQEQ